MNDSPLAGPWIRRVPPRRLAAFAVLGAVYVALFSVLFLRRTEEYLIVVSRTFEFARPWLEWLEK